MKVILLDGQVREGRPVGLFCTGYRAEKIEMQPGDFLTLANLVLLDPHDAYATLLQLEGRFRPKGFNDMREASVTGNTIEVKADDVEVEDMGASVVFHDYVVPTYSDGVD